MTFGAMAAYLYGSSVEQEAHSRQACVKRTLSVLLRRPSRSEKGGQYNPRVSLARQNRLFASSISGLIARQRASWLALALTLLAAGMRFYRLGQKSIWWDEGFSVFMARLPLAEMAAATAHDTHPPGYYALLHLWRLAAGNSEVSVRLLSALAGVLVAPLAYRVVRGWGGRRAALAAAALIALNRVLIWYSQEVRQYALAACLGMASAALAIALWRRRGWWVVWAGYVAVNAAGLLSLYLFASVLLAENLAFAVLIWRAPERRRLALAWLGAQAATGLTCLPWLAYYLPRAPHTFTPPATLPPLEVVKLYLATLFVGDVTAIDRYWAVMAAGGLLLLAGLWLAARRGRAGPAARFAVVALLAGALVPPALVWLLNLPIGLGLSFVPNPRYFVVLAPWAVCVLGFGAVGLSRRPAGRLALAGLAALWLGYAVQYYGDRHLTDDFISAARTLAAYRQPGDALVLHNDQNWPVAAYHLGGRDWIGLQSGRPMDSEEAARDFLEPAWNDHAGLWLLVTPEALDNDPDHRVYQWLAARALTVREYGGDPDNRLYFFARTPERAATADAVNPQAVGRPALSLAPAPGLTLERAEWVLPEYKQGDTLRLFLYWRNDHAPGEYVYEVRLTTLGGRQAEAVVGTLAIAEDSPSVIRQQVDFPVRAGVSAGLYWLSLAAGPVQARLGLVTVIAAQPHASVTSQPETTANVAFEQGIELLGYTARAEAGGLRLEPYWTTTAPVDTRYKFFAHVLSDGAAPSLIAQIDREPDFGAAPVTSWRVGETIMDYLSFELPAGRYTVHLGWYDSFSGQRLLVLDGSGQPAASEAVLGPFVVPAAP